MPTSKQKDACDLLDADHKAVKKMFAEFEHTTAKELISQIQGMGPDDALFDARVMVLGEYIDHHVKEERSEMFPKARASKVDLIRMRDALQSRKEALMAGLEQAAA